MCLNLIFNWVMTDGGADSGLRSEDGVVQCTYVANREAKK